MRLPGTFLHEREVLDDAVRRSLRDKAGIQGLRPEQLRVFDRLGRDDRGWVLSVAHLDVVPAGRLQGADVELRPVAEATGLLFDHDEIVRIATSRVRRRYREHPDPESRELRGHTGTVLSVAFQPGGQGLVSISDDGTVRQWPDELPWESESLRDWMRAAADETRLTSAPSP